MPRLEWGILIPRDIGENWLETIQPSKAMILCESMRYSYIGGVASYSARAMRL